jgi:hypothetical protein
VKSSWLALAALAAAGVAGGLAAVLGMTALAGNLLAAPVAVALGATGYRLWRYADRRVTETVYESVGGNPVDEEGSPGDADDRDGDGDGGTATGRGVGSEDWHRRGRVSREPSEKATADPEDPESWPWSDPFWYDPDAGPDGRAGPSDGPSGPDTGTGATDGGTTADPGTDPYGGRTRGSGTDGEWTRGGTTRRGRPSEEDRDRDRERGRHGHRGREADRDADGAGDRARDRDRDGDRPPGGDGWDPWWRRMHEDRAADGERSDEGLGGRHGSTERGDERALSRGEAAEILGVAPDADARTIRTAYRERVKETHPDTPGGSAESFKRVRRAYDRLADRE